MVGRGLAEVIPWICLGEFLRKVQGDLRVELCRCDVFNKGSFWMACQEPGFAVDNFVAGQSLKDQ